MTRQSLRRTLDHMNLLFPHATQFSASPRDLEQEFRLRQQVGPARATRRAQDASRFAALATRLRRGLRPGPCPSLVEEC